MVRDYDTAEPEKYEPFAPEPPKSQGRGCFFYGCIISIVLMVLLIIGIIITAVVAYRFGVRMIREYTDTEPMALPEIALTDEEREEVLERWNAFKEAVDEGRADQLALTGEEVTVLLYDENPGMEGKVHVDLEGDRARGQVSVPLADLGLTFGGLGDRYFNAEAEFDVSIRNGHLFVSFQDAVVKGEPVPDDIMSELRNQNLAEDFNRDRDNEWVRQIERLEVREGKLVIVSKGTAPAEADAEEVPSVEQPAEPEPEPEPDAEEPETAPPGAPTAEESPDQANAEVELKPSTWA